MIYNLIAIISSIIIPIILIKKPIKEILKKQCIKIVFKEYKYDFISYILMVIGLLIRSVGINIYPQGLNADEASSAYEAFSILNYGIDRNGNSFPVFLEAWGSGQNALYTYIMIPFIKILGLNIISTRLPMVIISCISLFVWYKLLEKIKNKKFAIIGLTFFVICPWHIMKSRWGLESNIFPDITLYAIFFIIKYIETKKDKYFYISSAFLGIAAYAYGTSYFFLPLFYIPLLIYLKSKKEINISKIFIGLAIIGIVSLPIILYVVINTLNLQEFKIGIFTVPKLLVNRYKEQTSLFSADLIINILKNIGIACDMLLIQNDGLKWNCIPGFGIYYIISFLFVTMGLIYDFKDRNIYNNILKIWFIPALLLVVILREININRINILIIPLVYYAVVGIFFLIERSKKLTIIIISLLYLIQFIFFEVLYFSRDDNGVTFVKNVEEVIKYVEELDVEQIYFEYAFREPYIYVLYYTNYNPIEFIKTRKYFETDNIGRFNNIKGFGKYNFYIPEETSTKKDVAYVYKKNSDIKIEKNDYNVREFKEYLVLYNN